MENLEPQPKRNLFGLSKKERGEVAVEESLDTLAFYLDDLFRIPEAACGARRAFGRRRGDDSGKESAAA